MPKPLLKKLTIQSFRSTQYVGGSLEKELINVFNAEVNTPYSDKVLADSKQNAYDFSLVYESFNTPKFDPVSHSVFERRPKSASTDTETSLDAVGKMLQMDIEDNERSLDRVKSQVAELESQISKIDDTLIEIEQMQLVFVKRSKRKQMSEKLPQKE